MNPSDIKSVEAEAGIIATIINHPEYVFFSEELKPNHFSDSQNGYIYYAVRELVKKGIKKIDAYNIVNILNARDATKNQTETITIPAINELIDFSMLICRSSAEEYQLLVKTVMEKAFRRELYRELQKCEQVCYADSDSDIKASIYNSLDSVLSNYSYDNIDLFGSKVDEMWREVEDRHNNGGVCGYPSKFPAVAEFFTYEKSELIVVCAHRKDGKSMFCLNELVDKLNNGLHCLYIDTEMSSRQHMERMISHLTQIPVKLVKNGGYTEDQAKRISDALKWIKQQKYVHVYMPTPSKDKIFTIAKRLQAKIGLDFVFFDYIKSQNSTSSSEIYNMMGDYTDFLKNKIAGELDIPVLAAAQLNRGGEIADSYKIEQFSSVIAIIKRKTTSEIQRDGSNCGNYKFHIKLNRLGDQMSDIDSDYIDLNFNGNYATFEQAKEQHEVKEPY